MLTPIDFPRLWSTVESQFAGSLFGLHGKKHWQQVERNALLLAEHNDLPEDEIVVVRLFAVLHDSQRINDNWDEGHGERAAVYARSLNATLLLLPKPLLRKLEKACARHELGEVTPDLLIGTCWDADRLDLIRVGATPQARYMSTPAGKDRAARDL